MANHDGLKYIKFTGVVQHLGSNATHEDNLVTVDDTVRLVDTEGETLELHAFMVEPNLWGTLLQAARTAQPVTLYMARSRGAGRTVAMVYALESQGQRLYYPKAAYDCLRGFALLARTRGKLVRNPMAAALLGCAGTLALFILLASIFGESALGIVAASLGAGYYAWWFAAPLLRPRKYANIDAVEAELQGAGFPFLEAPAPSAKY